MMLNLLNLKPCINYASLAKILSVDLLFVETLYANNGIEETF